MFKKIVEMITQRVPLAEVEAAIYKAFNADKPRITWEEHELLYKLIDMIYAED